MDARNVSASLLLIVSGLSGSEIWTMKDEREFIKGLGSHYQPGMHRTRVTYSKADALRGYLAGLELRTAWAGLNREELQQVAEEELLACVTEGSKQ